MRERENIYQCADPIAPGRPGYGDEERLSAQERLTVADRLLRDAGVSKVYVDDIVQCVADMVPKMAEDERYACARKIYFFLVEGQNFNGRETFKVFSEAFLSCLHENERIKLADIFRDGLVPDHITRCEAHMWGLVALLPTLPCMDQKDYVQSVLVLARDESLRDLVFDGVSRLVFSLNRDQRTDMAYYIAEQLRRDAAKDFKRFIVHLLQNVLTSLNEEDRILIADAVAPAIFDTDIHLVRRALNFFARHLGALPIRQRYPYALMISGLVNDISLAFDVRTALRQMLTTLTEPQEREHISWVIENSEEKASATFSANEYGQAQEFAAYIGQD